MANGTTKQRVRYFVGLHEGQWKITYGDKRSEGYATQAEAIRAAVDAAQKSGALGLDAQVLVRGRDSQFRTAWTYGNDPYPPPG